MFQVPDVMDNSLLRFTAHCTLLCAMLSLMHISLLSIYFLSCRGRNAAIRCIQEMQSSKLYSFWNFWVLVALPTAWACYSILLFLAAIVLFVWPINDGYNASQNAPETSLTPRIILIMVVAVGGLHFVLAICKLRRIGRRSTVESEIEALV
ncbi:hypothetical protein R3P38DRAFT_540068 [Favolaschia claudopus]|uniref:Uncharacterized protein n=1 Tax=Favolaschia claudopus TaxID=2862362 RepID=A0AAW0CF49_9AGAR